MEKFGFLAERDVGGYSALKAAGASLLIHDGLHIAADPLLGVSVSPTALIRHGKRQDELTVNSVSTLVTEEGVERVGVREHLSLDLQLDEGVEYAGDGICETCIHASGLAVVGLGLRVHKLQPLRCLQEAGLCVHAYGMRNVNASFGKKIPGRAALAELGDWLIFQAEKGWVGLYWGVDPQGYCDPLGGEGLWPRIDDGKTAPFFHGWENYLRQWQGPHGWRGRETTGLVVGEDSITLAWHQGADLPVEDTMNFAGAVALAWGESEQEVRAKMEALASPVQPETKGAAISGFDYLEGSYRFRRTEQKSTITLPADPLARSTVIRVDGPPSAAVACSVSGEPARPQLVSVGRVDDPYGPHEGRPDANGRPVLAQFEKPAERVELGVKLSKDAPTVIEVAEAKGISLSYLAQDDRRELLLFSHLDARPFGRLSLADLKLRDLRLPGRERATMSILPLYWFLMNAPSRFHSANLLESWDLAVNGPDEVRLSLSALSPGEKIRSTVSLSLTAPSADLMKIQLSCKLEILESFNVPHFQFCNLFPEHSRMPDDWDHAETLAMTRDDLWVVENRTPTGGDSAVEGKRFRDHVAPFFLSQYASGGGNFALLVSSSEPADQHLGYELCRCWLDNHLFVTFPAGGPEVSATYEVNYELGLWGDGSTSRDEVRELGRASVKSGKLEL